MSNTPEFNAEQLAAARATAWHQAGEPLHTLDSVRDFITATGILLFAPRPLQLPVPAPSLVEATIGASSAGPTDAQLATARALVARLVAEGNVLPLNLLGTLGETPDFIVSAQVFSFLYTLRGDKAWKQPPSTTGATKSSPLGVRIFEVLTEKGALTAADIATELGRELTESAVQRALTELWSNLRVIPLYPQNAGEPALWELSSRRFTKAIKAGINAGQPTALSALISLYLAQSLLATEEETEIFLSPLAARSRIREVTHALTNSRQLETIVLEGKSLLHIPGTLPEFPVAETPESTEEQLSAETIAEPELEGEGRIKRFKSSPEQKTISDFKGKPARTFGTGGTRPTPRFATKPDSERRPFKRDAAAKPIFTKPWEEDSKPRAPRTPRAEGDAPAKRPYTPRAAAGSFAKKPYTPRTAGGTGTAGTSSFPKRPYVKRTEGDGEAPKRPYTPRTPAPGGFAKKPYASREGGAASSSRPAFGAKRTFGDKPPFRKTSGEHFSPKPRSTSKDFGDHKPSTRKPYASQEPTTETPQQFRKFDAPKRSAAPRGGRTDKPAYGGSNTKPRPAKLPYARAESDSEAPKRAYTPRTESTGFTKRPYTPRTEGSTFPKRPFASRTPRESSSSDRPDRPKRPYTPREGASSSDRPAFGARRTFGTRPSFGDKPVRSFGAKNRENKPGGFSKRSSASDGKVSSDSKPFVRRGTPGVKAPFPRKPRAED